MDARTTAVIAPRSGPRPDELVTVWDGHPDESYRRDMSHWRGHGRWPDAAWTAIGVTTARTLQRAAASLGRVVPTGPLLEWGPGGGANLVALSRGSRRMYGVDLSGKNLAECDRVLAELDPPPDFRPILLGDDPADVAEAVHEPIEVFVSTAVFQHFPTRAYGGEVLRVVAGLLAPGALGIVQIRYDNGVEKYRQKRDHYFNHHVTFTSYALDGFWAIIEGAGLRPLDITAVNGEMNYATFTFVAP